MDPHADPAGAAAAIRRAASAGRAGLLALVRRHGGARVDADEVLQTALARALERSDQVRDPSRGEAWLGTLVRNVLRDQLRKRAVPTVSVEALEVPALEGDGIDCSCVLAQAEQLKPEYATILRRVVVDGTPVKDVAHELGLTPNNAMVRLHRARNALREQLAKHCGTTNARDCSECGCEERGCCARP